jgi:biotin operon repressor
MVEDHPMFLRHRVRVLLLLAFCLLISAATASHAQTSKERLEAFRAAITDCVVKVRTEGYNIQFDVYLTKANQLRSWGSEHDFYLFNKCMEQRGYDVQVVPKEGKR